jgi:hypothetical protein
MGVYKLLLSHFPKDVTEEVTLHLSPREEEVKHKFRLCMCDLRITAALWHRRIKECDQAPWITKYLVAMVKCRDKDEYMSRFAGLLGGSAVQIILEESDLKEADAFYYLYIGEVYSWYPDDGPWHCGDDYLTKEDVWAHAPKERLHPDMWKDLPTKREICMQRFEDCGYELKEPHTPDLEEEYPNRSNLNLRVRQTRSQTPPPHCNHRHYNFNCPYCLDLSISESIDQEELDPVAVATVELRNEIHEDEF